jgi:molybdopterin molybdotransferase
LVVTRAVIPFEVVQDLVLGRVGPLLPHDVELHRALGLVTAVDIAASESVPPFDNSAVDGYAVQAEDTRRASAVTPIALVVVGDLAAGTAPSAVASPGRAIRIMTGAPIPPGADAIVMVEDTVAAGDGVLVRRPATLGDHIRVAGGDIRLGMPLFGAGTVLTPAHLGVLASVGYPRVRVHHRPRVGVLSTGSELVAPGIPLTAGKIRDSNGPMLLALVAEAGCQPLDLGAVPDDEVAIKDAIGVAMRRCDALITSGGVSVGDYDYVKLVMDRLGDVRSMQVAIKPAKPFTFGFVGGTPVFGLPGNPVAAQVSFELFARPALRRMMGHRQMFRPMVAALSEAPITRHPDGKVHLDRVRLRRTDEHLLASRCPMQGSNMLSTSAAADGIALIPDGFGLPEGEPVSVMVLNEASMASWVARPATPLRALTI